MRIFTAALAFLFVGVASAQDYTSVIKTYLNNNRAPLGLSQQDVNHLSVKSDAYSNSMELTMVYVNQQHNGIDVFNSTSSFAVKNGEVVNASSRFEQNLASRVNASSPAINATSAISAAASALGLQNPANLEILESKGTQFLFSNGGISLENIPVNLVYQKTTNDNFRLAWNLSIYLTDASHWYSVRVDAVSGNLLSKTDWIVSCDFGEGDHAHAVETNDTSILFNEEAPAISFDEVGAVSYRVFPLPFESPNHGGDELVIDPADPDASPFGWHDVNGANGAEFTITRGNNVWAQEDTDANNGTGASPDGGAGLNFDFPFLFDTNPVNMLDASTTNLFYWNNIMHDVWYQYGFDEASGNFQENNYGNGGNGSDSVNADAQDGGGTNNANFGTPPDGGNPRMQMFLWSPAGPAGDPLTINNTPLAGAYSGLPAGFGDPLPEDNPITADLALVVDNDAGVSTDPQDACDTITNGGDLSGKIVVIRRGECEFGFKVLAAENEGAVAVIMVNNVADAPIVMGAGDVGAQVSIPSIMINQADGDALIAALLNGDTINGSLLNAGPYAVDGDLDNGIIAHEYGHGISNRLTGGPSAAGCLQNEEQMGEGWSDWFGLMLTIQDGDTPEQGRGIGTFAIGQPTTGGGIRPRPYSTDFSVNNLTYGNIDDGNISVPHGLGSIWATILWDLNWALVDEYGLDLDLYNGNGGNNLAMQLVIDGLKLQGCSPGFVDGRDGIIEADVLANNGVNVCLIWEVFARRGVGASADQGSSFNRSDQTEAFDLPDSCLTLNIDDSNFDNNFNIFPNPTDGEINIRSVVNVGETTINIFDMNGRQVYSQELVLGNGTSFDASSFTSGIYLVKIEGDNYTHTTKLIIR